jgi:hypothetical protein
MFKNERKGYLEAKKMPVSEKVINLSDMLKPNTFKNNMQNIDLIKQTGIPYKRHVVKIEKLNYDKFQSKLKTMNSLKNEDKEFTSTNIKNTIKTDKVKK